MDLHSRRRRRPQLDVAVIGKEPSCLLGVCADVSITYAPGFNAAVTFWFPLITFDVPYSEQLSICVGELQLGDGNWKLER